MDQVNDTADVFELPPATEDSGCQARPQRKRVRQACQRCRKHKLRCDKERPCALCAPAECQSSPKPQNGQPQSQMPLTNASVSSLWSTRLKAMESPIQRNSLFSSAAVSNLLPAEGWNDTGSNVRQKNLDFSRLRHHTQGVSAMGLINEVFDEFQHESPENDNFALPGGTPNTKNQSSCSTSDRQVPIAMLLGIDLPQKKVTDFLLNKYIDSVHWFMMVFHEPTFREEYEEITRSRQAPPSRLGFVVLLAVISAMGARYCTAEEARKLFPALDLEQLKSILITKVQEHIFDVFDRPEIEAVQICILLGSFYMYNAQPNLAFVVLGSGIKAAQAIGLHKEALYRPSSQVTREVQKRVWWALYVFDRFASIAWGRPCSINDIDCQVSSLETLDDAANPHPDLHSVEQLDNGRVEAVTTFSYQRFKFKLYSIASPILDVNFIKGGNAAQVIEKIQSLHERLLTWHESLPDELLLKRESSWSQQPADTIRKTFRLQALALQLAYDNLQILLHRPLLQFNSQLLRQSQIEILKTPLGENDASHDPNSPSPRTFAISKAQCWESALRTANIVDHLDVLRAVKDTHAAAYIGIQLFTAGIMLSLMALSQPLLSQAQEGKMALARVICITKALGHRTLLSAQSGKILEALVSVIMSNEIKELLAKEEDAENCEELLTAHGTPAGSVGVYLGARQPSGGAMATQDRMDFPNKSIKGFYDNQDIAYDVPTAALSETDFNESLQSVPQGKQLAKDKNGNPSSTSISNGQYSSNLPLGQDMSQSTHPPIDDGRMATLLVAPTEASTTAGRRGFGT
ncbi:hypothetical protein V499_03621 [Pseudogymnoascus sp. VKM F-103]|nr:hypothetical protein V499_03621 [Pseudogymnoascus sp. VKM F-103]